MIIRSFRYFIGGLFFLISCLIMDGRDLLSLVHNIKERINKHDN